MNPSIYQGNPAIFIRPVVFRPPITRGLAFHRSIYFNIIKDLYANTVHKKMICKYILDIQVVEEINL